MTRIATIIRAVVCGIIFTGIRVVLGGSTETEMA